jgi:transposase
MAGCASTPMDKRSLPGLAETAEGRLRAIGVERAPLNERMARIARTIFETYASGRAVVSYRLRKTLRR